MKFSQQNPNGGYIIRSYTPGEITITFPAEENSVATNSNQFGKARIVEDILMKSAIITPQSVVRDWAPQSLVELTQADLEIFNSIQPEVIILGTGQTLQFPNLKWIAAFHEQGIGFEVMDTGAACRTYNILMSDGRDVAAALLIS